MQNFSQIIIPDAGGGEKDQVPPIQCSPPHHSRRAAGMSQNLVGQACVWHNLTLPPNPDWNMVNKSAKNSHVPTGQMTVYSDAILDIWFPVLTPKIRKFEIDSSY